MKHYYYNKIWESQKELHKYHPSVELRNSLIFKSLNQLKFESILDVGCGDGDLLSKIKTKYPNIMYSGFDKSEFIISKNKASYNDIKFQCIDILDSKTPQKAFDIVICSEMIEHIKEYRHVIESLTSFVKPGGHLILTTQAGKLYKSDLHVGHEQHFSCNQLSTIVKNNGLTVLECFRKGFPFYTLQKVIYHYFFNFGSIMQKDSTKFIFLKRLIFKILYFLMFFSPKSTSLGPQLFLVARR
jgi:2-polyprenyl-3-methyl-5-hydroxy-6-metoxy-1,4-benzoquinol methylase